MNWIKYTLSLTLMLGQVAFGAGRLQNEDFKSVAELTAKGSDQTHLLNDTKIYVTSGGINSTLASAISGGLIGGGGSVNYITKGDAETGTNVNTYKNTAQLLPVSGTGGSPTVNTLATSTSSPLTGTRSYMFTHSAASGYGEGFSTDFTIPVAQEGRTLTASFDYAISSGTYVGGSGQIGSESDIEVWAYDVTNAQLIPINGYKVTGSVTTVPNYQFVGTFQTNTNSTSYRLIFHNASTNASAWAMKVDNITVTPQAVAKGAVVTDWVSYNAVIGGTGSAPTVGPTTLNNAQWSRIGDKMRLSYQFRQSSASSSAGSGNYLFPLPPGYVIDTAKIIPDLVTGAQAHVGQGVAWNSGPTYLPVTMQVYSSNTALIMQSESSNSLQGVGSGNFALNYGATGFSFQAEVPIVGWSSGQVLSSDAGNSGPVAFSVNSSSSTASVSAPFIYTTVTQDTAGGYSTSTGKYTITTPGAFTFTATIFGSGGGASPLLYKNGSVILAQGAPSTSSTTGQVTYTGPFLVGDTVEVRCSPSLTSSSSTYLNTFAGFKTSGSQQLAASDTVSIIYGLNATASVSSGATIKYDTKIKDSGGSSYSTSTGLFTAPISGTYLVTGIASENGTSGNTYLRVNNSSSKRYLSVQNSAAEVSFSAQVQLLAGDSVGVYSDVSTTYPGIQGQGYVNELEIIKVGNY